MKKLLFIALLVFCTMAAFGQQPVVAVAPFEAISGISPTDASMITRVFFIRLGNKNRVKLVDRNVVERIVMEHKFQAGDWSNMEKTAELGKALNADWIVRGELEKFGSNILVTIQFYDIKTFRFMGGTDLRLANAEEAYDKMDPMVNKLLETIANTGGTTSSSPAKTVKSTAAVKTALSVFPHFIGVGSTFSTPVLTLSLYNHIPIISSSNDFYSCLLNYGCDFGLLHAMSEIKDVNYYSFYPNIHVNFKVGIGYEDYRMYYFHFGPGAGYMLATYQFPNDTAQVNTLAFDAEFGFKIKYIHLLYNVRTNFENINHKATVGFYLPY